MEVNGALIVAGEVTINNLEIDVRSYGAVGDGTTDDTSAISNAISALGADGGTIIFPKGTYKTVSQINIANTKNLIFKGVGEGSVLRPTGSTGYVFRFTDCNTIIFRDLKFVGDGQGSVNTIGGLSFIVSSNPTTFGNFLENLYFDDFSGIAVNMEDAKASTLVNVLVSDINDFGIRLADCNAVTTESCRVLNGNKSGFEINNCDYVSIANSEANDCGIGFNFLNSSAVSALNCGSLNASNQGVSYPGNSYKSDGSVVSLISCYSIGSASTVLATANGGTFSYIAFRDDTGGTTTSSLDISVLDNAFIISDNADPTKKFQFQASSISAGQTRTLTVQDVSGTVYVSGGTDIPLADGGTNASLTASNGGIVYSNASALAILSGVAGAGKMLQSGNSAAPTWSTPTWPSASGTAGKVLRADGTNNAYSTFTIPDTFAQGDLIFANSANTLQALAKNTTATRYLANTGSSNNPAWAQVNLADGVTGDLPFANLTQGSALSVLGVAGNATADVASIAAGSDHQVLRRSGTALAFGAVNLAQSNAVTGVLGVANGGSGTSTQFTQGSVVFAGASGVYAQNNANFFWDNATTRLGLGDTTLQGKLHITGVGALRDNGWGAICEFDAGVDAALVFSNIPDGGFRGLSFNTSSSGDASVSEAAFFAFARGPATEGYFQWAINPNIGTSVADIIATLNRSGIGVGGVNGATRTDLGLAVYSNTPSKSTGNPWHLKLSNAADTKALVAGFDNATNQGFIGALEHGVNWRPLLINPNGGGISVGHGTDPVCTLDGSGTTDAWRFPVGTTAQRPGSPVVGMVRWNSDTQQYEGRDNGEWKSFVGVLNRNSASASFASSIAVTSIYSFSVPANILDTDKCLRLRIIGDYLNNSGSTSTLMVRISLGGTVLWEDVSTAQTSSATLRAFDFEFICANQNATNVQAIGGSVGLSNITAATTGNGDISTVITNATGFSSAIAGLGAKDTTGALTLDVSIQHSQNNGNTRLRRQFAILEIL